MKKLMCYFPNGHMIEMVDEDLEQEAKVRNSRGAWKNCNHKGCNNKVSLHYYVDYQYDDVKYGPLTLDTTQHIHTEIKSECDDYCNEHL